MAISKTKKYWEVLTPEPFILDENINDEDVISGLLLAKSQDEMSEVLFNFLRQPTKTFVLYCTENELKKAFEFNAANYQCKLEMIEDAFIISIKAKNGNLIGRGEVIPLGDKLNFEEAKDSLANHMVDFLQQFETGNDRLNKIMCKIKMVQAQCNSANSKLLS